MARKISISFKETSKDIELYNIIMNIEDKSSELKQILRKALVKETEYNKHQNEDVNILDF